MAVWAAHTYKVFESMAKNAGSGVHLVDGVEASRHTMAVPKWATHLPGFQTCSPADLPRGFASGWRYQAPIIDMPCYLDRLLRRLQEFRVDIRFGARLRHLKEAFDEADVVVNCSGEGARYLVPDEKVVPVRGQLVAVENPGISEFFAEHTDVLGEMTYLLPQGDVLLLGGSADEGVADPVVDRDVADAILARCQEIFPEIAQARWLEDRVGIRPSRPEVRVEREDLGDRPVVHNYGHAGAGVSLSWGCAEDVYELVVAILGDSGGRH